MISVATGGAWVFYFADAPTLLVDLLTGQAAYIAYASVGVLTATTFLFGGFAREQICIYMCPWPRIQAAMMDEETLTVTYRDYRGEPRGKKHENTTGDCIDCMACVNVCPMGIDIRDGQQLECITCALCIDACDDVMEKIGKPRGLIDYCTLTDQEREAKGGAPRPALKHIFRLRTMVYTAIWSLVGVGLIVALFLRSDIEVTVAPVRNPLYVTLSDGTIRNAYEVRLLNKQGEARPFRLSLVSEGILRLEIEGTEELTVEVPADQTLTQRVYVSAGPDSPAAIGGQSDIRLWIEDLSGEERASVQTVFHGRGG